MSNPKLSKEDVSLLYGFLKELEPGSVELFVKVAKHCSEDEFAEAVLNKDLPPIKLSSSESELLRAGAAGKAKQGSWSDWDCIKASAARSSRGMR